jgi:hypothetical protein|nr:MAG TPA: hypothetical protein [Caudoviricetes sp.]
MQTTRKILVKRKKMTKSDKGGFEFKISINTYIDNINPTLENKPYDSKEIIILRVYKTQNKSIITGDYKKGKYFTMNIAKHILHNKKVIDTIAQVYHNKLDDEALCDYLPTIDSLIGDILTEISLKGEK